MSVDSSTRARIIKEFRHAKDAHEALVQGDARSNTLSKLILEILKVQGLTLIDAPKGMSINTAMELTHEFADVVIMHNDREVKNGHLIE